MQLYTYDYNSQFDPAMPVIEVLLMSPDLQETSREVLGVVDSGSDRTTVPTDLLEEIGELSIGTAIMSGVWGDRRRVNVYIVTLAIGPYRLPGVHVAGVGTETGCILGRNVINQLKLILNGPANVLEIPAEDN